MTAAANALRDKGIISATQRDEGLAHASFGNADSGMTLGGAMMRLVVFNIVTEEDLARIEDQIAARFVGEDCQDRRNIISEAKQLLEPVRQEINLRTLGSLVADGLIPQSLADSVSGMIPRNKIWRTSAAAITWMRLGGALPVRYASPRGRRGHWICFKKASKVVTTP